MFICFCIVEQKRVDIKYQDDGYVICDASDITESDCRTPELSNIVLHIA